MNNQNLTHPLILLAFGLTYAIAVYMLPRGRTLAKVAIGVAVTNVGISAWLKANPEADPIQTLWFGYLLTGVPMAVGDILTKKTNQ